MKSAYRAISGRIRAELRELAQVVERTSRIWQQAAVSADDYYVDATALNLHGFYAGIEHLLEVIASGIDQAKPSGPHWHEELLRQMAAEIPGVRPPVLSLEARDRLDRYRGFRHVVRNVYTFNLRPSRLQELVTGVQTCYTAVRRDLELFADFLDSLTQAQRSRETEAYGEQEE